MHHREHSQRLTWTLAVAASTFFGGVARSQPSEPQEWSGTAVLRRGATASSSVDVARTTREWTELWTPIGPPPAPFDESRQIAVRIIVAKSQLDGRLLHVAAVREEDGSLVVHYTRHAYRPTDFVDPESEGRFRPMPEAPPPRVAYLVRLLP